MAMKRFGVMCMTLATAAMLFTGCGALKGGAIGGAAAGALGAGIGALIGLAVGLITDFTIWLWQNFESVEEWFKDVDKI